MVTIGEEKTKKLKSVKEVGLCELINVEPEAVQQPHLAQ